MSHQELDWWYSYRAEEFKRHRAELKQSIVIGAILIVFTAFVILFMTHPVKWALIDRKSVV